MAKGARDYELVFIVSPNLEEEKKKPLLLDLEKEMKERGGEVIGKKGWGKKQLAYHIKRQTEGDYFFWQLRFKKTPQFDKINLFLEREEAVLRYLWIKK